MNWTIGARYWTILFGAFRMKHSPSLIDTPLMWLESDQIRLQELLAELGKIISTTVPPGTSVVRQGDVYAQRAVSPTPPQATLYTPVLCVVAQGRKEVRLGNETYTYDPSRFLVNSTPVPATGWVVAAERDKPCLWLAIGLEPSLVREVVSAVGPSSPPPLLRSMEASLMDVPLLEVVVRLARLLTSPRDFDFLSPLVLREIIYRLLSGPQAERVRQIAAGVEEDSFVMKAIERLRRDFDKPLTISELARVAGLSSSALHRHFKEVTSMTPVQYQRQLRLQEASRLMLAHGLDARQAGHRVGYDDPSYFSREYRRFFGLPPAKHVALEKDRGVLASHVSTQAL